MFASIRLVNGEIEIGEKEIPCASSPQHHRLRKTRLKFDKECKIVTTLTGGPIQVIGGVSRIYFFVISRVLQESLSHGSSLQEIPHTGYSPHA